jgi:hypothetical protein
MVVIYYKPRRSKMDMYMGGGEINKEYFEVYHETKTHRIKVVIKKEKSEREVLYFPIKQDLSVEDQVDKIVELLFL